MANRNLCASDDLRPNLLKYMNEKKKTSCRYNIYKKYEIECVRECQRYQNVSKKIFGARIWFIIIHSRYIFKHFELISVDSGGFKIMLDSNWPAQFSVRQALVEIKVRDNVLIKW